VTRKPTAPPDDPEKKERVIHTRVPESLEAQLRQKAQDLGISDVVSDIHEIARVARGEKVIDADVIGWQPLTLAKNAVCSKCNEILPKGKPAAIGMTERGAVGPIVCNACMEGDADE
jgi:hypothetical protein